MPCHTLYNVTTLVQPGEAGPHTHLQFWKLHHFRHMTVMTAIKLDLKTPVGYIILSLCKTSNCLVLILCGFFYSFMVRRRGNNIWLIYHGYHFFSLILTYFPPLTKNDCPTARTPNYCLTSLVAVLRYTESSNSQPEVHFVVFCDVILVQLMTSSHVKIAVSGSYI